MSDKYQIQKILNQAGRLSAEEFIDLINSTQRIILGELKEGKGRLKKDLSSILNSLSRDKIVLDSGVLYLPLKFNNQPILAYVMGDTHGDSWATRTIISRSKFYQPDQDYYKVLIFLGDYADRGSASIKNLELVLSLKNNYPSRVFLLRGNHEDGGGFFPYELPDDLNYHFGTRGEEIHQHLVSLFKIFPNLIIAAAGIALVHGGIPNTDIVSFEDLKGNEKLFREMRWNDPNHDLEEREQNIRGMDFTSFGEKAFLRFLKAIDAKVLIRSHEYPSTGFELFFNNRLITIFSNGGASPESKYQGLVRPRYLKIDLSKKVEKIDPRWIYELK